MLLFSIYNFLGRWYSQKSENVVLLWLRFPQNFEYRQYFDWKGNDLNSLKNGRNFWTKWTSDPTCNSDNLSINCRNFSSALDIRLVPVHLLWREKRNWNKIIIFQRTSSINSLVVSLNFFTFRCKIFIRFVLPDFGSTLFQAGTSCYM